MPRRLRNVILLVKPEATYGVDAGPTAGANAFLMRSVDWKAVSDGVERPLIKATMGALPEGRVKRRYELELEVELQGSGAAGTAPAWGPLLRACGYSETITASTKVEYKPVSSGFESATIWFYADGVIHKATGVRGAASFSFPKADYPILKASLIGLYSNPADGANVVPTLTSWKTPAPLSKDNTPTFSMHGQASVMRSLDIDTGASVIYRDLVGAKDVNITGRRVTGELSLEAVSLATKDWYAAERAGTLGALSLIHGSAAGSIIELAAAKVQIGSPEADVEDDILYDTLPLLFTETVGDDEFSIIAR